MSHDLAPRSVAFAAFRVGGFRSLLLRPGSRHPGWVLVAGFGGLAQAGAFARWAAAHAGRSVAVRVGPGEWAGDWLVSCPVAWPSSRGPVGAGRMWQVAGGLRPLVALLPRLGLG